ncbi:MAG: cation:proton antiporter [Fuerstiella sp.]
MDLWILLGDIVLLLTACLLFGGLCSRLGQSPLVGYLVAGMLLGGPGSIQLVQSEQEIEAIAELGVALLLFSLGLEFSIERLRKLGVSPLAGGAAQVVLTVLIGAGAAWGFGLSIPEALAFGAMISLSSTAVVLRMLMERTELDMPHGRNSLAVLLTQDLAVVPLALLMTVLGGDGSAAAVAFDIGRLIAMTGLLVLGLFLLNKVALLALGTLTLYRNRELTVIFAVVTGLGAAWAAHAAGISPALGAFAAGMFLGSSAFATQVRADVSSLRVLLLTLFFGAAGMVADPIWILKNLHIVAAVTALLTIGKLVLICAIFQTLGQTVRVAASTGLCLAQIGEFAFVLGSIGRSSGVVSESTYALVVSVTIVSFFLSAMLVPAAPKFGNRVARLFPQRAAEDGPAGTSEPAPDVLVIGFGPAGRIAAQPFMNRRKRVVVIDLNRDGVQLALQSGFCGQIGDATQSDVLEHAHVNQAAVVVITVPHHRSALSILEQVRLHAPLAHVVVRSRYQMHSDDLAASGAHVVVGDEETVGAGMATQLEEWLAASERNQADEADDTAA